MNQSSYFNNKNHSRCTLNLRICYSYTKQDIYYTITVTQSRIIYSTRSKCSTSKMLKENKGAEVMGPLPQAKLDTCLYYAPIIKTPLLI